MEISSAIEYPCNTKNTKDVVISKPVIRIIAQMELLKQSSKFGDVYVPSDEFGREYFLFFQPSMGGECLKLFTLFGLALLNGT